MLQQEPFSRDEILPSWFMNRIQDRIAGLTNLRLSLASSTIVEAAAGADDDSMSVPIDGNWRWIETPVQRTMAGGAGTYLIFATARSQNVVNTPNPNTDLTNYAFDLAIVATGNTPTIVPGTVDIFRRVGRLVWSGSAITALVQEVGAVAGAQLADGTLVSGSTVEVTRQADGSVLLSVVAASIGATQIAASLKPSGTAAAGTEALRALGTSASTAAAGNDGRFPAGVDIVDGDVSASAAIAESKLALGSDAAAGTASRRTLGTGALQAAAGNDARFPAGADIVNADVSASAAILMSKLALAITNAEVASGAGIAKSKLAALAIVNADVDPSAAIGESKLSLASDAAAGTASRRTLGTGALQAAAGNDPRLSDARAPTSHTHPESEVTSLVADLALKAPLASPAFTGNPTAPTPAAGDSDTSVATSAFVAAALAAAGLEGVVQEGVDSSTDCAITWNSASQVTIAAGSYWARDAGTGLLVRRTSVLTVLSGIPVAGAGTTRLDQAVMDAAGTVTRLQGTQAAGVTRDNRNGAAAIPAGSKLLHDLFIDASPTGGVWSAANIRDRRLYARGALGYRFRSTTDISITNTTYTDLGSPASVRVECSGLLAVRIRLLGTVINSGASATTATFTPIIDGGSVDGWPIIGGSSAAASGGQRASLQGTNYAFPIPLDWVTFPAAGSHLFTVGWASDSGISITAKASGGSPLVFLVEEFTRRTAFNGTT